MNNEEKILLILEDIQKQIASMGKGTNDRFDSLEKHISKEIQSTRDELKTEIQYVYEEVKDLKDSLSNVEQVTAKNWLDITRLKAIK